MKTSSASIGGGTILMDCPKSIGSHVWKIQIDYISTNLYIGVCSKIFDSNWLEKRVHEKVDFDFYTYTN